MPLQIRLRRLFQFQRDLNGDGLLDPISCLRQKLAQTRLRIRFHGMRRFKLRFQNNRNAPRRAYDDVRTKGRLAQDILLLHAGPVAPPRMLAPQHIQ